MPIAAAPAARMLLSRERIPGAAPAARMLLSRERIPGLLAAAGLAEAPVQLSQEMNPVWT